MRRHSEAVRFVRPFEPRLANCDRGAPVIDQAAEPDRARYAALLRAGELAGRELTGVDLTGADGRDSDLHGSALLEVVFDGASLADAESLVRSATGLRSVGSGSCGSEGRRAPEFVSTTLRGAVVHRATLDDAQLTECDLSRTDLRGSSLARAVVNNCLASESCLAGATLAHAMLAGSQFGKAVLTRAEPHPGFGCRGPARRRDRSWRRSDRLRDSRQRPHSDHGAGGRVPERRARGREGTACRSVAV